MRRALAAVFAFALILALAPPATAATPSPQRMAGQIRTLQKQVKTLQKTVKKVTTELRQTEAVAVVALLYGGCTSAATADAFQGGSPTAYGTTAVNDFSTCSDLSRITGTTIARQPNTATVNVFQTLLNIFK
jgi:endonuclease/exonuclease/phosphatase (EEP) superfamily protein YafD